MGTQRNVSSVWLGSGGRKVVAAESSSNQNSPWATAVTHRWRGLNLKKGGDHSTGTRGIFTK